MLTRNDEDRIRVIATEVVRRQIGIFMKQLDDKFQRWTEAILSKNESHDREMREMGKRQDKMLDQLVAMRADVSIHEKRISKLETA